MSIKLRLILTITVIMIAIGAFMAFDGRVLVLRLFDWLEEVGPWAVLLFILTDMVFVILVLPGIFLTMGAGFLFGVLKGSLYVVVATSTGASIAFFVARRLLDEQRVSYLRTHPRLGRFERGVTREGWKLVLLTRLIPFFPFKLSNYFFGATRISFPEFFIGTLIGIVPFTLTNVYLGSIVADLATLGTVRTSRTWLDWLVYGIGFVATVAAVIIFVRLARKALAAGNSQPAHRSPNGHLDLDVDGG